MYDGLKITGMNAYEVHIHSYCEMSYRVIARNRSSALYRAYLAGDYMEYIPYAAFIKDKKITKSVRKLHPAVLSDLFDTDDSLAYCKKYRGMQFLQLGMKVRLYDDNITHVIGSDGYLKAYIPLLDKTEHFHPTWQTTYYDEADHIIADYRGEDK